MPASDDAKIQITLDAVNSTRDQLAAAEASITRLNATNQKLTEATTRQTSTTREFSQALGGTAEAVHSTTQAFVRAERTILHVTAVIAVLKETYELLAAAIELVSAQQEQRETFIQAREQQEALAKSILRTVDAMEKQGQITKVQANALKLLTETSGSFEELHGIAQGLISNYQTAFKASLELIRAQLDLELIVEHTRFERLKQNNEDSEAATTEHYKRVLDIATRGFQAEYDAVGGNVDKQLILQSQFEKKKVLIAAESEKDINAIHEKASKQALADAQADTKALINEGHRRIQESQLAQIAFEEKKDEIDQAVSEGIIMQDEATRELSVARKEYNDALDDTIARLENINSLLPKEEQFTLKIAELRAQESKGAMQDAQRDLENRRKTAVAKMQLEKDYYGATASLLGSAADAAKLFGREGFIA